jgi:hypothetical protein
VRVSTPENDLFRLNIAAENTIVKLNARHYAFTRFIDKHSLKNIHDINAIKPVSRFMLYRIDV